MKKVISFIFVVVLIALTLYSCGPAYKNSISPKKQPMTKWVAEEFELYVTDTNKGLMICNFNEKTIAYDVAFLHGSDMLLMDRRPQDVVFEDNVIYSDSYEKPGYSVAIGSYTPSSETSFRVKLEGAHIKTSYFSKELVFKRVATDLKTEDIPVIETDIDFNNSPIYSIGSKWISNDDNISIYIEGELKPYDSYAIGKVAIKGQEDKDIYIAFNEIDSTAYLGFLKNPNAIGLVYDVELASDKWNCEFFKDYFVATIISSNYYENGTVLVFNRYEISQ